MDKFDAAQIINVILVITGIIFPNMLIFSHHTIWGVIAAGIILAADYFICDWITD